MRTSAPRPRPAPEGRTDAPAGPQEPAQASSGPARSLAAAPAPGPVEAPATRKFTALIEERVGTEYDALVGEVGRSLGRIAGRRGDAKGGRLPSKADVLRALVTLTLTDPELTSRLIDQVRTDLTSRHDRSPQP